MKSINIILSENIKSYRKKKNISQEELSLKSGLSRTYISDLECCKRNVSIKNLEKIANALSVKPYELIKE